MYRIIRADRELYINIEDLLRGMPLNAQRRAEIMNGAVDDSSLMQMLAEHRAHHQTMPRHGYGFDTLEVGQYFDVERVAGQYGYRDRTQQRLTARAYQERLKTGRRFTCRIVKNGNVVRVTRVE